MRWRARLGVVVLACAACRCGRDRQGDGPPPPGVAPDAECLAFLDANGIAATRLEAIPGVRTPVRVNGAVAGLALVPRAGREAVMDCALARGLFEAAPVFHALGLDTLEYSSAYDYRTRRGAEVLSAHAHGLAIDVHVLRGAGRRFEVRRDFEAGVGEWRKLRPGPGRLTACIGQPRTEAGTTLRRLVCRLKLHTAFRVIVTPDDNADHRDHLHLEVYPDANDPS